MDQVTTGIVREGAHVRGSELDTSTLNFGCIPVQSLAACMAGECFIHCAMPLGQFIANLIPLVIIYANAIIS